MVSKTEGKVNNLFEKKELDPGKDEFLPFFESPWPDPPRNECLYGLPGEVVNMLSPYCEGDNMAILTNHIVYFGNIVGRKPYFQVGATKHYLNEYVGQVGKTSKSRKGTANDMVYAIYEIIDEAWTKNTAPGLSSGEGLIAAVADEIKKTKINKKGVLEEIILVEGVEDKRLLVVEQELAGVFQVMNRQGNTLSALIRTAYDRGNLRTLTKNSPIKATDAHISIIGHTTDIELQQTMTDREKANGIGNRFFWICVRRSKVLPNCPVVPNEVLNELAKKIKDAVLFATIISKMQFSLDGLNFWERLYPVLTTEKPGILGAITSRAEVHVLRWSMSYALQDLSIEIRPEHIDAALAAWEFSENSCKYLFGSKAANTIEAEILQALKKKKSLSMSEIRDLFERNLPSVVYKKALKNLYEAGLVGFIQEKTAGRNKVLWFLK